MTQITDYQQTVAQIARVGLSPNAQTNSRFGWFLAQITRARQNRPQATGKRDDVWTLESPLCVYVSPWSRYDLNAGRRRVDRRWPTRSDDVRARRRVLLSVPDQCFRFKPAHSGRRNVKFFLVCPSSNSSRNAMSSLRPEKTK